MDRNIEIPETFSQTLHSQQQHIVQTSSIFTTVVIIRHLISFSSINTVRIDMGDYVRYTLT